MTGKTYATIAVCGFIVTLAAAAIGRKDIVPPLASAPSSEPVKVQHCLYVFSSDNCPWCDKLHKEMEKDAAKAALDSFAVSEVKDSVKAWRWRVRAYPTMVVTDAADKELGRHEGYMDAKALAAWLAGFHQ